MVNILRRTLVNIKRRELVNLTGKSSKIQWHNGSIYPMLKKMESQGFIKSYWRMEEEQRPRKYYNLTEAGMTELQNKKEDWLIVNDMLTKLFE